MAAVKSANDLVAGGESQFCFQMGEENTVGANSRQLLNDGLIYWTGAMDGFVKPTGPFDPQLPVLAFRGADGNLRAAL